MFDGLLYRLNKVFFYIGSSRPSFNRSMLNEEGRDATSKQGCTKSKSIIEFQPTTAAAQKKEESERKGQQQWREDLKKEAAQRDCHLNISRPVE